MGAGEKWGQEYANYLKGKNVVILPDNDEAGRKHAENVALSIEGTAKSIKIVPLPGLEEKGDVTDWVAMNLGHENKKDRKRLRKKLLDLAKRAKKRKDTFLSRLMKGSDLQKLDLRVEWAIEKILPQQSITLLHGKGGIGKTWFALSMALKLERGERFLGERSRRLPVAYVDFENSAGLLADRVRMLNIKKTYFWHSVIPTNPPPQLDTPDWELYKRLPKKSLIIFDTLRASQNLEENSSQDMASVMNKLKELRDRGNTILLLHHTPKNNAKTYKGSTAILDLADHILSLEKEKGGDVGLDGAFKFGTEGKTRYKPFVMDIKFSENKGFILVDTFHEDCMKLRRVMENHKELTSKAPIQSDITGAATIELEFSKNKTLGLLKRGAGQYWDVRTGGKKNASTYTPKDAPETPSHGLEKKEKKRKSGTGGYSTDISPKRAVSTKRTKNKATKPRKHIRLVEA